MEKIVARFPRAVLAWVAWTVVAVPFWAPCAQETGTRGEAGGTQLKLEDTETTNSATGAVAPGSEAPSRRGGRHVYYAHRGEEVVFGNDVEVKAGQEIHTLVVFGGSALVKGKVTGDVVVFGGGLEVQGEVGGDVVVFLGGLTVRSNAVVNGDAIGFGGRVEIENDTSVHGESLRFGIGLPSAPDWLSSYLRECVFKLRPLAPGVSWVWWATGVFWLLYVFIALVFRRPVAACVAELTDRPATSFFMGLLTKMLLPVAVVILAMVVVGLVVVPFLVAAVIVAALFGKVGVLEWIGIRIGKALRAEFLQQPMGAFVVGSAVVLGLYLVPVVGLLTFAVLGVWGLGAAVTAAFGGLRREMPGKVEPTAMPPIAPEPPVAPGSPVAPMGSIGPIAPMTAPAAGWPDGPVPGSPTGPASQPLAAGGAGASVSQGGVPPVVPEILGAPYAGFWERMGAAFLDVVLVGIASGLTGGHMGPLIALAYFAGMWTWKGTTLGGSLLGLKVVRQDGQPLTFAVALVRGLAAGLSTIVLFLGFFWIAWDPDRQGWHDKIAGTVVLKLPRGVPLVCI